ncbi:MAG: tetratricopeptide repeat protein, partial [Bacteroidota bacterium]
MLLPLLCWAESDPVDSLRQVVSKTTGVERIESLRALSEVLENESYEAAREAAQEAVNLARELEDQRQLGLSLSNLAIIQDIFSRYSQALVAFREAAVLLADKGKADEIANNDIYMGMTYHHMGQADSALKYCSRGSESFFHLKDSLGYSESLNNLALIQKEAGEYTESSTHFFKALDWAPKNHKSHIVGNIGILFLELQEGEKALDYFHQCYALERAKNSRVDIGYTLGYLGGAHYMLRNADSALYYFQMAHLKIPIIGLSK